MDFDFGSIRPSEILAELGPFAGHGLFFNIMIYVIFLLTLIAFFLQDDKQLRATILLGLTLVALIISKLNIFNPKDFLSLVINAGIFVIPLIVTGMSKAKNSQPLTIIAGILGGVYFFSYWFFLQRPA